MKIHEILYEVKKELSYGEGTDALDRTAALKGCGISIFGDTQNMMEEIPEWPALADST